MASKNVAEFTTANWEQEVVQSDKPVLVADAAKSGH